MPAVVLDRLEKMSEFIMHIMDSNGHVPDIGDSDDGQAVKLCEESGFNNFKSILTTAAILFKRADFKKYGGRFDEKTFWLLGAESYPKYQNIEPSKMELASRDFSSGGYYIMRSGSDESERVLIFDCGELGYSSMSAHGHADSLNILVNAFGEQLIIDPGTYSYIREPDWRNYFRGTLAHNTISVNNKDQSQIFGPFLWNRKAKSKVLKWVANNEFDFVAGEHDGYMKGSEPIMHHRKILFAKPHYWLVVDFLFGKGKHVFTSSFHFSRDVEVEVKSNGAVVINRNDAFCRLMSMAFDQRGEPKLNSELNLETGWVSPEFGMKHPAPVLSGRIESESPVAIAYLIYPYKTQRDEFVSHKLSLNQKERTFSGEIAFKSFYDSLEISKDNHVKLKRVYE